MVTATLEIVAIPKKNVLKITRADVSLYSTRHFFADLLDTDAIAQRIRDRILGHVGDVRTRYGRKGILDPAVAAQIEALEPPVMKVVREILLSAKQKADDGRLRVLKTHLVPPLNRKTSTADLRFKPA